MKLVRRDEVTDLHRYDGEREELRRRVLEQKRARRVHLTPALVLLFENHDTVRYQIQEVVRAEGLTSEEAIRHELETYNELLGGPGELGCTLFVEVPDAEERRHKLSRWVDLPQHVYLRLASGQKIAARYDVRQILDGRISPVQFLKFNTRGEIPVAVGIAMPDFACETRLSDAHREALQEDLQG